MKFGIRTHGANQDEDAIQSLFQNQGEVFTKARTYHLDDQAEKSALRNQRHAEKKGFSSD